MVGSVYVGWRFFGLTGTGCEVEVWIWLFGGGSWIGYAWLEGNREGKIVGGKNDSDEGINWETTG